MVDLQQAQSSTERILDAAESWFAEKGFAATSINDVCERSGLPVGSIYHHFGNKEGLLMAVLDRGSQRINAHLAHASEQPTIEAYFDSAAAAIWEQIAAIRIDAALGMTLLDPNTTAKLAERRRASVRTVASVITLHCERAGVSDPTTLAWELANFSITLTYGAVVRENLEPGEFFDTLRYGSAVIQTAIQAAGTR
jgi:AcrR family transcriptional regulator